MERMARDAVETIRITGRGMHRRGGGLWQWAPIIFLFLAAAAFTFPRLQTAAGIGLALLAYSKLTTARGRYTGPYAGIAARVVRTQMLFVEDSAGRARAWLGVENEYDDEHGARLVFYDEKGRARLALRFADETFDRELEEGARAEVVAGQRIARTYLPPPFRPGEPPPDEAEGMRKHGQHIAGVHVQMESEHARDWAETHSVGARKAVHRDDEGEDREGRYPTLVMFDGSGKASVVLDSGLTVTGAKDLATVLPSEIFLMSDGKVTWEAP